MPINQYTTHLYESEKYLHEGGIIFILGNAQGESIETDYSEEEDKYDEMDVMIVVLSSDNVEKLIKSCSYPYSASMKFKNETVINGKLCPAYQITDGYNIKLSVNNFMKMNSKEIYEFFIDELKSYGGGRHDYFRNSPPIIEDLRETDYQPKIDEIIMFFDSEQFMDFHECVYYLKGILNPPAVIRLEL